MSRISIDVSPEEHRQLKALAALQGVTLREYVLERVLGKATEEGREALADLTNFLDARVRQANQGEPLNQSVEEIFDEVHRESAS